MGDGGVNQLEEGRGVASICQGGGGGGGHTASHIGYLPDCDVDDNHAVFYCKMILKLVQFFSQPLLISFKRDKNVGNFLVRSAFKTIEKPGTFKCARSRCKTCPFVQNADKISGPK